MAFDTGTPAAVDPAGCGDCAGVPYDVFKLWEYGMFEPPMRIIYECCRISGLNADNLLSLSEYSYESGDYVYWHIGEIE